MKRGPFIAGAALLGVVALVPALVTSAVAANVLPGALGGEVEGSDRLVVDAHINATGGVIRQRETQIEGIGSSRRREVDRGVLVIQGHVGLARGLNSRRFEVIGALERRPVGAARLLGLVSRVGDARTGLYSKVNTPSIR